MEQFEDHRIKAPIETPFGLVFGDYEAAEGHADALARETGDPHGVIEHIGSQLFPVVPMRLADEYMTRCDSVLRYQTDGSDAPVLYHLTELAEHALRASDA